MVSSMYEFTSAGLKNKTGWPECSSGNLWCCVSYHGSSSGMTSVLSGSL